MQKLIVSGKTTSFPSRPEERGFLEADYSISSLLYAKSDSASNL